MSIAERFDCCSAVYRVTVSVLTIAGTDCKLVELGAVASETGGQVSWQYSLITATISV